MQHWFLEFSVDVPTDAPDEALESSAVELEAAEEAIVEFAKAQLAKVNLPAGSKITIT